MFLRSALDLSQDIGTAEHGPVEDQQCDAEGEFGEVMLAALHRLDDGHQPDPVGDERSQDAEDFHLEPAKLVHDDNERERKYRLGTETGHIAASDPDREETQQERDRREPLRTIAQTVGDHPGSDNEQKNEVNRLTYL